MAKYALKIYNPGRSPVAYYTDFLKVKRFKATGETQTDVLTEDVDLLVNDLRAKQPALQITVLKEGKPVDLSEIKKAKKAEKSEPKPAKKAETKKTEKKPEPASTDKTNSSAEEKGAEDDGKTDPDDATQPDESEPVQRGPGRPKKE